MSDLLDRATGELEITVRARPVAVPILPPAQPPARKPPEQVPPVVAPPLPPAKPAFSLTKEQSARILLYSQACPLSSLKSADII
jgi:hypothetical protein